MYDRILWTDEQITLLLSTLWDAIKDKDLLLFGLFPMTIWLRSFLKAVFENIEFWG